MSVNLKREMTMAQPEKKILTIAPSYAEQKTLNAEYNMFMLTNNYGVRNNYLVK